MFWMVILGVYVIVNLYVILWFWRALRGSRFLQVFSCVILFALSFAFPLSYKNPGAQAWQFAMLWVGAVWLGIFIYVLLLVLVADLVRWFKLRKKTSVEKQQIKTKPRYIACGCVAFLSVLIAGVSCWIAASPVLNEYELTIEVKDPAALNLPDNTLTIAVISDIHLGRLISAKRFEALLELTKPLQPDAIFLVGDILDDHIRLDVDAMRAAVDSTQAPLGVWGVLGNHEYLAGNVETSMKVLQDSNIKILRDQWILLNDNILLVGRDDYSKLRFLGQPRASLKDILQTVPEPYRDFPIIELDHQPHSLEEAQEGGVALQLSGHTHKGQLWPHSLLLYLIYENPYGFYQKGYTQYFVSLGGGTWGPPMRNTAWPEAVVLKLRFVEKK